MQINPGFSLDDVLLVPKYSEVNSRSEVDTSVQFPKGISLKIPIISSNMKTITEAAMASKICELGGMGILHRFVDSEEDWINLFLSAKKLCKTNAQNIGVSIGVRNKELYSLQKLCNEHECRIVCIDVAHGDHLLCLKTIEKINKLIPNILIIAGNIATADGANRLYSAGTDVLKLNVGNGSICSTRIETGNGVPTFTAMSEIQEWRSKNSINVGLVCDGGCKAAGDFVKSLCFVDAVMTGNTLAGTDEAPGNIINKDGSQYKLYAGSSTHKTNHIEGVAGLVPYRGPVDKVVKKLLEGIKSGCSYQGVSNLTELKKNPEFVSITHAGLIESRPHDVILS